MKKIFFSALAIGVITFTACNSGGTKNEHEGHDMNKTKTDTAQHVSTADDADVKIVSAAFTNVDVKAAATIKDIVKNTINDNC